MFLNKRYLLLHSSCFILALLIGVTVSQCWLHFGPAIVMEGRIACGKGSTRSFRLLGAGWVSRSCYEFSSSSEAVRALQTKLGNGTVLQQSTGLDKTGETFEEVIAFRDSRYVKLLVVGNVLCSIDAPTLQHVRWMENR